MLVVDSDPIHANAMGLALRAAGFRVQVVGSASDAADIVLRLRPNVIVLAASLPRYTGLEFLECLQVSPRGKDIPVVMLVKRGDAVGSESARNLGAAIQLADPCTATELVCAVETILERTHGIVEWFPAAGGAA